MRIAVVGNQLGAVEQGNDATARFDSASQINVVVGFGEGVLCVVYERVFSSVDEMVGVLVFQTLVALLVEYGLEFRRRIDFD